MGFASFLLGRDTMGHAFSINYKGNGSYQTPLGACITIIIQVLALIQCLQQSRSMIEMTDPLIQSYKRSMYRSEIDSFGAMNLD